MAWSVSRIVALVHWRSRTRRLRSSGMPAAISVASWRVNIVRSFCLTRGRRKDGSLISAFMPPFFAAGLAAADLLASAWPMAVGKRFWARICAMAWACEEASMVARTSLPEASVAMKLNLGMAGRGLTV